MPTMAKAGSLDSLGAKSVLMVWNSRLIIVFAATNFLEFFELVFCQATTIQKMNFGIMPLQSFGLQTPWARSRSIPAGSCTTPWQWF